MSQNDQNPDQQNQGEGYQDQQDETLREGRGDSSSSDSEQVNPGSPSQDRNPDAGEADDTDEDRDDDLRNDGSADRRNNIG
jgi:hypothetical protein